MLRKFSQIITRIFLFLYRTIIFRGIKSKSILNVNGPRFIHTFFTVNRKRLKISTCNVELATFGDKISQYAWIKSSIHRKSIRIVDRRTDGRECKKRAKNRQLDSNHLNGYRAIRPTWLPYRDINAI